ncbi:MAG: MFS transporter [Proteobacteria bacterium]|nr:MFS transporter [Desulfobacterales bacterium]MBL7171971.1 MFS transporter [Desulfobacteraceae bacterium]MBU0734662.1 MFS transporter [Pseudomonadota bacterium]MBU1902230.1 MFS transporter [Pseudomonadota bacterium]
MESQKVRGTKNWSRGIPQTVWALGFVSMFMDVSSEMIHSLLPVFLVSVLGSSAMFVGLIEGVAEATALITRTFSGALSDWLGKRKALAFAGYALGTLTKPLFAVATGVGLVFAARFLDRIGKGVRGAPRDALIAEVTHPDFRGAAYGLRQSLDTVGAFVGPLLAMVLMIATAGDFRSVFWAAVLPGLLSVSILAFAVKEPDHPSTHSSRQPIRIRDIMALGDSYWMVVAFGSLFTFARFSEAFLLLRAESVGVAVTMIPIMLVLMNVVYSLTAYPVGLLSDRLGRTGLLAAGLAVLVAADLSLATAKTGWEVAIGTALWGLHMGLTQGLLAAMVADTAHENLRGTAFGIFSMASGIAILVASLIAGWLWDLFGPPATFLAGAAFAAAALIGYLPLRKHLSIG